MRTSTRPCTPRTGSADKGMEHVGPGCCHLGSPDLDFLVVCVAIISLVSQKKPAGRDVCSRKTARPPRSSAVLDCVSPAQHGQYQQRVQARRGTEGIATQSGWRARAAPVTVIWRCPDRAALIVSESRISAIRCSTRSCMRAANHRKAAMQTRHCEVFHMPALTTSFLGLLCLPFLRLFGQEGASLSRGPAPVVNLDILRDTHHPRLSF